MKSSLKIILLIILVFGLMQLVPVDRTNLPIDVQINFVDVHQTPKEVTAVLKKACYDCHSNETIYPQYAYVAPISWAVKNHINNGRKYLNFSVWESYNADIKNHAINKTIEAVEHKTMPLPSYINYHPEAKLTDAEKKLLINYFETFKKGK